MNDVQENKGPKHPPVTAAWTVVSICAAVIGFSLVFLRLPFRSGPSVLPSGTLVDRYTGIMTHPITIVIEIVWVYFAFAKKLYGWWLVLFAGLIGQFLGALMLRLVSH
jgi:hypothetical protein